MELSALLSQVMLEIFRSNLFSLSNPSLAADKELAPDRQLSTSLMVRIVAALARYLHACDWRNAGPQQTCTGHNYNIISQNLLAVRYHGSARKGQGAVFPPRWYAANSR
ncbi:hypothetical protein TESG_06347 [Trichophyton tonsurans CBS 112818]|uniref:Uncharacterized protein n=2 Tax=Trichophyton TaxID=5550 RepID=F2PZB1_TRIEC|nr:hypothetical protein TESG_06347 [Trichophyton tonsurans CBS 112818]EGE07229.1 hypothetical protein TEQG_06302 [Trichophyton equinum CBS 127.97]